MGLAGLRRAAVVGFSVALLVGAAAAPAAANPSHFDRGLFNCDAIMADTGPRWFDVYSNDPAPRGGNNWGYMWVDRRLDRGYNICVEGVVKDIHADAQGAIVFLAYEYYSGGRWYDDLELFDRADGSGIWTDYGFQSTVPIRNALIGVCLISGGIAGHCNLEDI